MYQNGIKAIIIEGISNNENLKMLVIDSSGIRFEDAAEYRGDGNYDLSEKLHDRFGEKAAILSIGPAGEQRLATACIQATDLDGNPSRAAGRGGSGAVLGSKGIKAIVSIPNPGAKPAYSDEETFRSITKVFSKSLIEGKKGLTDYGTAAMVAAANKMDGMPTRNYSTGTFDRADKISGEALRKEILERGGKPSRACHPGCVIRCSNVFTDKDGNYITSSLEYETMVLVGPNLDIGDLDSIARIDRAIDDIGLDSIDTGVALGVAMEMGMIEWGDTEGVLAILEEVKQGKIRGKLIGSGAAVVGKVLGAHRVPEVKGQSLVAYEPRTFKGMGCTFATSPMGADHTAGPAIPGRIGLDPEKSFELTEAEGQPELSRDLQIMITVCDSMGYCFFVGPDIDNMKRTATLLNACYGWNLTYEDIIRLGSDTLKSEQAFNEAAGISKGENRLPEFFYDEKLPVSGRSFDVSRDELRDISYDLDYCVK